MMFGHLPGSYVTINLTRKLWQRNLGHAERQWVYTIGIVAGILPDLDALFLPLLEHRASIVHTPFFWLVTCVGIAALALILPSRRRLLVGLSLAVFIGAMTHLVLDAIFVGVKLLYPISIEYFRFRHPITWRYNNWIVNYILHPIFLTEILTFVIAGIIFQTKRCRAGRCKWSTWLRINRYWIGMGALAGLAYFANWYIIYPSTH